MVGKKGAVSAYLTPFTAQLHNRALFCSPTGACIQGCSKSNGLYDSCIVLLMSLYYFYHNSPKQRQSLKQSFLSLRQSSLMPTRVGGTSWVGYMELAIENFV